MSVSGKGGWVVETGHESYPYPSELNTRDTLNF